MSENPLVTFETAENEHLQRGIRATPQEALAWIESSNELAALARKICFSEGKAVIDGNGSVVWSEDEYWGYPTEEKS